MLLFTVCGPDGTLKAAAANAVDGALDEGGRVAARRENRLEQVDVCNRQIEGVDFGEPLFVWKRWDRVPKVLNFGQRAPSVQTAGCTHGEGDVYAAHSLAIVDGAALAGRRLLAVVVTRRRLRVAVLGVLWRRARLQVGARRQSPTFSADERAATTSRGRFFFVFAHFGDDKSKTRTQNFAKREKKLAAAAATAEENSSPLRSPSGGKRAKSGTVESAAGEQLKSQFLDRRHRAPPRRATAARRLISATVGERHERAIINRRPPRAPPPLSGRRFLAALR